MTVDIVCLTEAHVATCPPGGHTIEAAPGNAVADRKGAKKVLLWSRKPWKEVKFPTLSPPGRIVSGTSSVQWQVVRFVGVCIPWAGSRTPRSGGDRSPWSDHIDFLEGLHSIVVDASATTMVLGDFNQTVPPTVQPRRASEALRQAFAERTIATRGFSAADGKKTIDHVAHSQGLHLTEAAELPRIEAGLRISDHFGLVCTFAPLDAATRHSPPRTHT